MVAIASVNLATTMVKEEAITEFGNLRRNLEIWADGPKKQMTGTGGVSPKDRRG